MGEEIHVTYHCKMEANWDPEHMTMVLEDYAQHVILGVSLADPISGFRTLSFLLCVLPVIFGLLLFQALCLLQLATHLESKVLDLKHEALESLSIGMGGTKAATIWGKIAGAFALHKEPVIHPYADYSGEMPDEDPFDAVDLFPSISHPLGYELGAAPGYKLVDHIEAALQQMQIGMPLVALPDALGPQLIPDNPTNPASWAQIKATVAQQRCAVSSLPSCVALADTDLAYPINKKKTSAAGIPQKYLSK